MEKSLTVNIQDLEKGYDGIMYNSLIDEYVGYSDFFNYGYWKNSSITQQEASEDLVEQLLSSIPEKSGTILDVACGKGATSRYLLQYYPPDTVTGINISEKQLETARGNAPGCSFYLMDATHLEFTENSFDNIICVEAAFHFDTREAFFKEAHRVLKPGGRLVLSDILMNLEAEQKRKFRTEKNYVRDLEEYRQVLHRSGFIDIQIVDATKNCWHGHFWGVVRYFHEKFFDGEIDRETLEICLDRTYKVVFDLDYYILAAATKQ